MTRLRTTRVLPYAALVLTVTLTSLAATVEAPRTVAGKEALDYGFRFASTIHSDPKDKQKAQQAVVLDYPAIGLLDEALKLAEQIEGWRRGAVLADLATLLAQEGRKEEARVVLAKADQARQKTPGWEGPRISAHLAQANAALGDVEASQKIADELVTNDARQYAGRASATKAAAQAAEGRFGKAMEALAPLDGDNGDVETVWWRTVGYLGVAREERLTAAERRQALDAARRSADGLVGWKQAQALQSIAEEYDRMGVPEAAHQALDVARQRIEELPETDELRPALLSNLARGLAHSGETERVQALLAAAEASVPRVLNLDRPALYANIASSWSAAGAELEMWRLYEKAFDAVEALQNARPRALAVVEVCRSLGRNRIELNPRTRERLDGLLAGLEAPG